MVSMFFQKKIKANFFPSAVYSAVLEKPQKSLKTFSIVFLKMYEKMYDNHFFCRLDVWNCVIRTFVIWNCMINIFGAWRSTRGSDKLKLNIIYSSYSFNESLLTYRTKIEEIFF